MIALKTRDADTPLCPFSYELQPVQQQTPLIELHPAVRSRDELASPTLLVLANLQPLSTTLHRFLDIVHNTL